MVVFTRQLITSLHLSLLFYRLSFRLSPSYSPSSSSPLQASAFWLVSVHLKSALLLPSKPRPFTSSTRSRIFSLPSLPFQLGLAHYLPKIFWFASPYLPAWYPLQMLRNLGQ